MTKTKKNIPKCYCGSLLLYHQCCAPLLNKSLFAKTAEQLMRSRYSAYCSSDIDYLMDTLHHSQRINSSRQQITISTKKYHWLQLQIKSTKKGQHSDLSGEVEYVAIYQKDGKLGQLHEHSRFVKEQNVWFYVDGDIFNTTDTISINLSRNDPCWCNSGKKFKKCHG